MKILKSLPVYCLTMLTLAACSIGNSPKKTAQKFLNAFNEKDYAEARLYSTPETIKLIDLMENLSKMATDLDTVQHAKIEVLEERMEGEAAFVTFREEGSEETEELKLVKVDGKWLVHITKTDMTQKEDSVFDTEEGVMMEPDSTTGATIDSSESM